MKKLKHSDNTNKPENNQPRDEWDLESLRVNPSEAIDLGVKKIITYIPVGRPGNQEFFRVRPGDDWRLVTVVIESKEDREVFLVAPHLRDAIPSEVKLKELICVMTRQNTLRLWPLALPGGERRQNSWAASALVAAKQAETRWVRMSSNMAAGMYDVYTAAGELPDPEWPDLTLQEIMKLAFRGNRIDDLDHDVLRRLRGEF